jgi:DNA repair protein RadA/Sms
VPGLDRRLAEAARLGFTEAVVPAEAETRDHPLTVRSGMRVHAAPTLDQALAALDMVSGPRRPHMVSRA